MHKDDPISSFSISSIKQEEEENIIRCTEEGKKMMMKPSKTPKLLYNLYAVLFSLVVTQV